MRELASKSAAEFTGTFFIVFFGCGAVALNNNHTTMVLPHSAIALIFGLAVAVMICAFGHISAAHFNPAVTLGFAATKRFPLAQTPAYVLSQILGAMTAVFVLKIIFPDATSYGVTTNTLQIMPAFLVEFLLTFVLMTVISAMATDERAPHGIAGIAIGGAVTLCALVGGPLTGASMNPARSLAPALIEGRFDFFWLYVTAPTAGAIAAAFFYNVIRCQTVPAGKPATEIRQANGCC